MANETNVEKLQHAGVIDPTHLDPEHINAINAMSPQEVATLIRFKSVLKASGPLAPNARTDGTTDAV